jgi:RimJ/RimL family protein N-acetyltransferase
MPLSYRLAESRDLPAVFDLYMDPASNALLTYDPMSHEEFSSLFNTILRDKNLYVVEVDSEIVATFRLIQKTHRQSHIIYLGGFTVKTSMKGRGLGFEILKHIKEDAERRSLKRLELTVDTQNHAAINLYRKVGFEIEGKLKNNYRLSSTGKLYDEYVMALLLH